MAAVRVVTWSAREPGLVVEAAALLERGEVVAHPTETVYGLAAAASQREGHARLLAVKGGTVPRPFLLLFEARDRLEAAVGALPPGGQALAAEFWPGPLTMLFPASADLPAWWSGPEGDVAVRLTPHPFARALIARLGGPILSTSANRAGGPVLADAASITAELGDAGISLVVDGGPLRGAPSTLLRWADGEWEIGRSGPVTREAVERVLARDASLPAVR